MGEIKINLSDILYEYSDYTKKELNRVLEDLKNDVIQELNEYVDIIDDEDFENFMELLENAHSIDEWNEEFNNMCEWCNYNNIDIIL